MNLANGSPLLGQLRGLLLGGALAACTAVPAAPEQAPGSASAPPSAEPDTTATEPADVPWHPVGPTSIAYPGPDFGFFPNVPNVLPAGGVYLETAFGAIEGPGDGSRQLGVPMLLRVGMGHDWELRLGAQTIAQVSAGEDQSTGAGPVLVAFRRSFWRARAGSARPGLGLESGVTVPVGSESLVGERIAPYAQANMEFLLPASFTFVTDVGVTAPSDVSEWYAQGVFNWAVAYAPTNALCLYVTGQVLYPATKGVNEAAVLNGPALSYNLTRSIALTLFTAFGATSSSLNSRSELGLTFSL